MNPQAPARSFQLLICYGLTCALGLAFASPVRAQTLESIYAFIGYNLPYGALVADSAGNLYGTTFYGGTGICKANEGCGTVFELSPGGNRWTQTVLYSFQGLADGENPETGLVFDRQGNLYGTSQTTVFELSHSPGGTWSLSTLYTFSGPSVSLSLQGPLVLDAAGNVYGAISFGGDSSGGCNASGCGTIYRLSPNVDGSWTETVLHAFSGGSDGGIPVGGLTLAGRNLIGATYQGGELNACSGNGCGVVFELSPIASEWKETLLHSFVGGVDGAYPGSGITLDTAGNLFGTTFSNGELRGTIFKLSPSVHGWNKTLVHRFTGTDDGVSPVGPVSLEASGSIIGESANLPCTQICGVVFELSPQGSSWRLTSTYPLEYGGPSGGPLIDGSGNIFGMYDGTTGEGNSGVFEIMQ